MKTFFSLFLICAALLSFTGCRQSQQAASGPQPQASPAGTAAAHRPRAAAPTGEREEVVLTAVLPPSGEKLKTSAVSGHGQNCPQGEVSALLGVEISSPHGLIIGKVLPEGIGAKAGLKPGDSIIKIDGKEITCPSTFVPYLGRSDKPKEVKLTVLRPKAKTPEKPVPPK